MLLIYNFVEGLSSEMHLRVGMVGGVKSRGSQSIAEFSYPKKS